MNRTNAKSFRTRLDNRAYTLAELLLVVGLLSVLSGVGMVGASRMLRRGRQAALDKTAQTLYLAVQRNLTAAKLSGATFPDIDDPAYQSCVVRRSRQKPVFGDGAEIETVSEETPVCQLWKGKKQNATLENIVFRNVSGVIAISEELLAACWVITFDPSDGVVLDAYFGQYDGADGQQSRFFEDLSDAELAKLTAQSYRLERGALIGYYGSDAAASLTFPALPETPLPDVDFDGGSPDVVSGMELPGNDGDMSASFYPDAPDVLSDVPQTADPSGPADADPEPTNTPDVSDADAPASLMPDADPAPDDNGDISALLTPDEAGAAADNPDPSAPDATATRPTPANDPGKIENVARKLYCWIGYDENPDAPIVNAERLVTRLNCWVPKRSAFDDKTGPVSVDFTLKVMGVDSGRTKTFQYRMDHFGFYGAKTAAGIFTKFVPCEVCREEKHTVRTDPAGPETTLDGWLYSYPVILDSLSDAGETATLDQDCPFRERFPVSEGFVPGENVMLRFEVDVEDRTKERIWESLSDIEKAGGPGDNASVADKIAWLDEHAALWKVHRPDWDEYPVCNSLFADASVVDGDGVYVAEIACRRHLQNLDPAVSGIGANLDAVSVRAAQVADIAFDAETAFTPISNDKLTEYDGRGHTIENLRGAGLFGTLDGGGAFTLSNLTLRSPVVVADGANVGAFVGKAVKPVALENLTLTDAEIRVIGANAGGVIGQAVADVTAHGLKVENLRLTDTEAQTVGGVIGLCGANVTLSDIEMVNPKLRGGAGTIAGGVIGKADGQVMISSARLHMSEDSYRDADLDAVRDEWLTGGEYVGGLIGYASGNVTIDGGAGEPKTPSFAATVVNASAPGSAAYAGGLAGYVTGALNADYAWADCYVVVDSGAFIGGLAGHCGGDSAFTHCYAAGFAVGDADHMTVAGFAPNAVKSIRDAYSIFDADGYGLAEAGDVSEAYYVRGHGVGQVIDRDALRNLSLDGFRTVPETQACFYALSDADFDSGYPYPILDGQSAHYNDFAVRGPTEITLTVELVFRDTSGDAFDADTPEQLREALFSVSPTLCENQDARARLTIQAVAGETLSNVAERLTFDGYALDERETQTDVALTPDTDTVEIVYARKRHVLSYDLDGGTCHDADAIAAREASYGQTLSDDIPDANAVKKDGYDFKGWRFYRLGTDKTLATLPTLYEYAYDADGFLADENGNKVIVTFKYENAGALSAKLEYWLKPVGDGTEFQLYNLSGAATLYGEPATLKETETGKEWTAEYQHDNWLVIGTGKNSSGYYYVYAPNGSVAKISSKQIYYKDNQFYCPVRTPLSVSTLPPTVIARITLPEGRATLSTYQRPLAYGALRDEVLVTPDKLRMPDFDVTAQAIWEAKNA